MREIVNLLLLRGNIGREGAGPSPVRGHSNVQGNRTCGIDSVLRRPLPVPAGSTWQVADLHDPATARVRQRPRRADTRRGN